jgi:hypothetical protein
MTSTIISGLTTTVSQPAAPVLDEPGIANGTLLLTWSAVPTATKYSVHYTDIITSVTNTIDAGDNLSYALTGLVNGHDYTVTVSAVAQPTYFFSVTAFDHTVVGTNGGTPGTSHESDYSTEVLISIGDPAESPLSNPKTAFPEAIIANPNLPNKGCFIATAAYGYYSAPQVRALREFRDRYLVTNAPGRAFVRWYYQYGPIGAEYLIAHPRLKPLVRIALMPLVGGAFVMVHTSPVIKIAVMMFIGFVSVYLLQRRNSYHSGGTR